MILCTVDLSGGVATVSQVAAAIHRANHTATARINHLENQRIVARSREPQGDRRRVWVRLTPSGAQRLTLYRASAQEVLGALVVDPSDEDAVAEFSLTLAALAEQLSE